MADGDSTNISEVLGSGVSTLLKPVGEELGRWGETVKQSVATSGDPEEQAKKEQEEKAQKQKDEAQATNKRQFFADLAAAEAKVRQDKAQKEQERTAIQAQDDNKDKVKAVEENKKEADMVAVTQAQTATEVKNTVGG